MTFTDDDLKRLKVILEDDVQGCVILPQHLRHLLARLEAAEECLELPHMKHTEETNDMKCTFCSRYKAWCKAAGK